jgi:hypothetical protein
VDELTFKAAPFPVLKWPLWRYYANQMFLMGAEHINANYRTPFLWLEADAVPMRAGWMQELADSYYSQPKWFHGPIIVNRSPNRPAYWPEKHMAGVAIYPVRAANILKKYCGGEHTWDLGGGLEVVPKATRCRLIQHDYGPSEEKGWSFTMTPSPAPESGTIEPFSEQFGRFLPRRDCALFHRCKDGSLIRCLREMKKQEGNGDHIAVAPSVPSDLNLFASQTSRYRRGNPQTAPEIAKGNSRNRNLSKPRFTPSMKSSANARIGCPSNAIQRVPPYPSSRCARWSGHQRTERGSNA